MTLTEARDAFAALLVAGGVPVADLGTPPPAAAVFGDGIVDLEHIARGQAGARFRVTLLAGGWLDSTVAPILDQLKIDAVAAIREAPGWRLDEVRRDTVVRIAGGDQLAADVVASCMIDL
jgi:hypothetical protein